MLLAFELLSLALLVVGLFAVWRHRRQRAAYRLSAVPARARKARSVSARTEMRAFGDSVTVMRTLDRSNGNGRAVPKQETRRTRA